jgi:hypothetical protein
MSPVDANSLGVKVDLVLASEGDFQAEATSSQPTAHPVHRGDATSSKGAALDFDTMTST